MKAAGSRSTAARSTTRSRVMPEALEPRVLLSSVELLADVDPTDGSSTPSFMDLNGTALMWVGGSLYASDGSEVTLLGTNLRGGTTSPIPTVVARDTAYFQVPASPSFN